MKERNYWRLDGTLPMPVADQVAAISKAYGDVLTLATLALTDTCRSSGPSTLWRHRRPESRVVSLFGPRGTGKTTALEWLLALLRDGGVGHEPENVNPLRHLVNGRGRLHKKFLVLPIVDASVGDDEDSLRYQLCFALELALARLAGNDQKKRNLADRAIESLRFGMAGQDGAWRAATARLSGDMSDFTCQTAERVKAVVDFGTCFGHAIAAVLDATGKDCALLAFDDLDLAPQQYADVISVLGDVRCADNVVVVVCGHADEVVWRVEKMLEGSPIYRADAQLAKLQTSSADEDRHHAMALRIVAKLCPVPYRATLTPATLGQRLLFPFRFGRTFASPTERVDTIAGLLAYLGVADADDVRGLSRPYRPQWAWALPDNLRGLDALFGLLRRVADRFDAKVVVADGRPEGALDDDAQAGDKASPDHNVDQVSGEDGESIFEQDWFLEPDNAGKKPLAVALLGLAAVAELGDLNEWCRALQRVGEYEGTTGGEEARVVLLNNVDLTTKPLGGVDGHIGLAAFADLNTALMTGRDLARWFSLDPAGALTTKSCSLANPHILVPCLADLALRRIQGLRAAFAVNWWFTRGVLESHAITAHLKSGESAIVPMRQVLELIQEHGKGASPMPLFASLAELLSLCEALGQEPYPAVTAISVDEGMVDAAINVLSDRWIVYIRVAGRTPSPVVDKTTFCKFIGFLAGLWLLRRAMVRAWATQHYGIRPPPDFRMPGVQPGSVGVELVHVLDRLLQNPVDEMVSGNDRWHPVSATAKRVEDPSHRWAALASDDIDSWLNRETWQALHGLFPPSLVR